MMEELYFSFLPPDMKREIIYNLQPPVSLLSIEKLFDYKLTILDYKIIMKLHLTRGSIFMQNQYEAIESQTGKKIGESERKSLYELISDIEKIDCVNYQNDYKSIIDIIFESPTSTYYIKKPLFIRIDIYENYPNFYPMIGKYIPVNLFDKYFSLFINLSNFDMKIYRDDLKRIDINKFEHSILYLILLFQLNIIPEDIQKLHHIYNKLIQICYVDKNSNGNDLIMRYIDFIKNKIDKNVFETFIKESGLLKKIQK